MLKTLDLMTEIPFKPFYLMNKNSGYGKKFLQLSQLSYV